MKLTLKRKLILGALSISIAVIVCLMIVISYIINAQNIETSQNFLKQSFNIILDELSGRQQDLLENTRQLAFMKGIDLKTNYLSEEKSN